MLHYDAFWNKLSVAQGDITSKWDIKLPIEILRLGADINAKNNAGETPLMIVCDRVSEVQTIQLYLERGAHVSYTTAYGTTPLHKAASQGKHEFVGLLLEHGADVLARDINGRTALHVALHSFHMGRILATAEILLKDGADVNARDADGQTPLHMVASHPLARELVELSAELVEAGKLLIDIGADVEAKDERGVTVLQLAQNSGRIEIVELLMASGYQN